MNNTVMCHVVAGYPSPDASVKLMLGMQLAGAAAVEVQIPFSDPIADGEAIMRANDVALEAGMTTSRSFELIERARQQGLTCPTYVMSYLQKLQHFGFNKFCQRAHACGVLGLIIPDLPIDSAEFTQLSKLARRHELNIVPVLSPAMAEPRLQGWLAHKPPMVYVTSRRGITGNAYVGSGELKTLVAQIRQSADTTVLIGFGIATPQDVTDALTIADMAVVGSAIIKRVRDSSLGETFAYIRDLVKGGAIL